MGLEEELAELQRELAAAEAEVSAVERGTAAVARRVASLDVNVNVTVPATPANAGNATAARHYGDDARRPAALLSTPVTNAAVGSYNPNYDVGRPRARAAVIMGPTPRDKQRERDTGAPPPPTYDTAAAVTAVRKRQPAAIINPVPSSRSKAPPQMDKEGGAMDTGLTADQDVAVRKRVPKAFLGPGFVSAVKPPATTVREVLDVQEDAASVSSVLSCDDCEQVCWSECSCSCHGSDQEDGEQADQPSQVLPPRTVATPSLPPDAAVLPSVHGGTFGRAVRLHVEESTSPVPPEEDTPLDIDTAVRRRVVGGVMSKAPKPTPRPAATAEVPHGLPHESYAATKTKPPSAVFGQGTPTQPRKPLGFVLPPPGPGQYTQDEDAENVQIKGRAALIMPEPKPRPVLAGGAGYLQHLKAVADAHTAGLGPGAYAPDMADPVVFVRLPAATMGICAKCQQAPCICAPTMSPVKVEQTELEPDISVVKPRVPMARIAPLTSLTEEEAKRLERIRQLDALTERMTSGGYEINYSAVEVGVHGAPLFEAGVVSAQKTAEGRREVLERRRALWIAQGVSEAGPDFTGPALQRDWETEGAKAVLKWIPEEEELGHEARERRRREEQWQQAHLDWLSTQVHNLEPDEDPSGIVAMEQMVGRESVRVSRKGQVSVTEFMDPLRRTDPYGPGAYSVEDPDLKVKFGRHERVPSAMFGHVTSRADAVGPQGQRPPAALDADGYAEGQQLLLEPSHKLTKPRIPAAQFSNLQSRAELDGSVDDEDGHVLDLNPHVADSWVRPAVMGNRYVSFDKQIGRAEPEPDADGDVLELDINRRHVDPAVPGFDFSKRQGRLDARKSQEDPVLELDVPAAQDRLKPRVKGVIDMTKGIGREDLTNDTEPDVRDYDVIEPHRRSLAIGVVPMSKQPERWQQDDDEDPHQLLLSPKIDLMRERPQMFVQMDKSHDRWQQPTKDDEGTVLDLEPNPHIVLPRVPPGVSMDKHRPRWEPPHSSPAEGTILDLDPVDVTKRRSVSSVAFAKHNDRWAPDEPAHDGNVLILDVAAAEQATRPAVGGAMQMNKRPDRFQLLDALPEVELELSPRYSPVQPRIKGGVSMAKASGERRGRKVVEQESRVLKLEPAKAAAAIAPRVKGGPSMGSGPGRG